MIFHKFDINTNLYLESADYDIQPENSVSGILPEITESYTLALIDGVICSVLKPQLEIVDNQIISKSDSE